MRFWTLLLLVLSPWVQAVPCPDRLRIGFLDAQLAGFLNGRGEQFAEPQAGSLVDDTRNTLAALGCPAELLRLPARRLMIEVLNGSVDIVVPRAAQPSLLLELAYPTDAQGRIDARMSLAVARAALYARVDRGWTEAPSLQGRRVGVLRGSVTEDWLKARRLIVQEVPDPQRGLEMLRRDHIELLVMPHLLISDEELASPPALRELRPPLAELHYYAPANRGFATRHPAFLQAFWLGLCQRTRQQFSQLPACPA